MAAAPQRGANPSFATEEQGEVVCLNNNEHPATPQGGSSKQPWAPPWVFVLQADLRPVGAKAFSQNILFIKNLRI